MADQGGASGLLAPLAASDYEDTRRLAALFLPTATADIRLLNARKLVEYIDGGGCMKIRQELEAERPECLAQLAAGERAAAVYIELCEHLAHQIAQHGRRRRGRRRLLLAGLASEREGEALDSLEAVIEASTRADRGCNPM